MRYKVSNAWNDKKKEPRVKNGFEKTSREVLPKGFLVCRQCANRYYFQAISHQCQLLWFCSQCGSSGHLEMLSEPHQDHTAGFLH